MKSFQEFASKFGRDVVSQIPHSPIRPAPNATRSNLRTAFTIIELLAVIVVLGVLAAMLLPAMAGIKDKGGRTQCATNLRQIGIGSMMYANDFDGWLPPGQAGANPLNLIRGLYYSRFFWNGTPYTKVTPQTGVFQNAGYLFRTGLTPSGEVFFCPAQWSTVLGANYYAPLITSDSSGVVRTSYGFNPRVINANGSGNLDLMRRYQKSSQLEPQKLFAVDFFEELRPQDAAHAREGGWNVLLTDCSVNFRRGAEARKFAGLLLTAGSAPYYNLYHDLFYDALEQDR